MKVAVAGGVARDASRSVVTAGIDPPERIGCVCLSLAISVVVGAIGAERCDTATC